MSNRSNRSSQTAVVFDCAMLIGSLGFCCFRNIFFSTVNALQFVHHAALNILMFVFAEKNLSYQISSFNESTGFGLLKASPVEFVKYPFVKAVKLIISFILNKLQYLERKSHQP